MLVREVKHTGNSKSNAVLAPGPFRFRIGQVINWRNSFGVCEIYGKNVSPGFYFKAYARWVVKLWTIAVFTKGGKWMSVIENNTHSFGKLVAAGCCQRENILFVSGQVWKW